MGVPTDIKPFLESDLFSTKGKLRASLDFVIPRSNAVGDQSLGHFFRRRFGDELVENIIEPLLSGIYSSDIDKMSLLARSEERRVGKECSSRRCGENEREIVERFGCRI